MEYLDLYKQSQTHKIVSQDLNSNMLNHCYLIVSKDSVFLHEIAKHFAKEILCLGEDKPCDNCNNCMKVNHSNMVDVITLPRDGKTLMVEDVIEIVSDCYIRPVENEYKIYILENFDKCTVQAQNKLLKTLEEPPRNVIFILTAVSSLQVLPTILSRAKVINEPLLDVDVLQKFLEMLKVPNAMMLSRISDGNIEMSLKLAESKDAVKIVDIAFDVVMNLKASKDLLKFSSKILELKKDIPFLVETLITIFRDIVVLDSGVDIVFKDKVKYYEVLKNIYSAKMCYLILPKLCEIFDKLEFNCNPAGVIDQLLLDILEVKFLCQK